ncbi:hypothetical protein AQUCO_03300087v1 [Aquilegia coerulea]|uniref:F-box protein At3g26010-like beta-propeller domain-containing protein n=1 Tax=Aquilegia coerulea TaxID=218851 RepID=A0A2G5CZF1_AQUCA|nr:hypothetical protein AQUCO_03300087v1 [Aquilegia coerulea]
MDSTESEKKAEMVVETEMGGLNEKIFKLEIFDLIPIKQLIQMKCLSKGWYDLISHYRKSILRSSPSHFICQYKFNVDQDSQVMFYNIEEQEVCDESGEIVVVETLENPSLSFSIDNNINLLGSSNGLILGFCKNSADDNIDTTPVPYVCNPNLNQWVSLPPFSNDKHSVCMALAFDGISQHHFKVVMCYVYCVNESRTTMRYRIYSSDTGKWWIKRTKLFNSSILTSCARIDSEMSYLYRKGIAHWVFNGFMLVYHFKKEYFKIVKLPTTVGCLWESEGYLHYCDNNVRGFSIWKLVDDEVFDIQFNDEDVMTKWQCKSTIEFCSLKPQFLEIVGPHFVELLTNLSTQLLGFDEYSQMLYFAIPDMVFSYSFETRSLKKLPTCNPIGEHISSYVSAAFCLQPSGVDLAFGGDCKYKVVYPKRECGGSLGKARILLQQYVS